MNLVLSEAKDQELLRFQECNDLVILADGKLSLILDNMPLAMIQQY